MPKVSKPRKHGRGWQINWIDGTGKRRYASFPSHKLAVAELRKHQAEADQVRVGAAPAVVEDHTFQELADLFLEVKHRKRSLDDDRSRLRVHLLPAFGHLNVREITPTRISRFERDVSRRLGTGTVRLLLALLRSMLNVGVEHGWLVVSPRVRLPKKEEREYQWLKNEAEMAALLRAAQNTGYPGAVEFYATALYTGMRAGELCGLHWTDVDLGHRLITVQRSYAQATTKSSKIRRIPILDPLLPVLRDWRIAGRHGTLVFPNRSGNMHVHGARIMRQTLYRCLEDAGLPKMRFHDLRHTFASHWMLQGGDLFRLQKILGHASQAMTQRYAHLAPDAFQSDWDRFGDVIPKGDGEVVELATRREGTGD